LAPELALLLERASQPEPESSLPKCSRKLYWPGFLTRQSQLRRKVRSLGMDRIIVITTAIVIETGTTTIAMTRDAATVMMIKVKTTTGGARTASRTRSGTSSEAAS
jgi:hypothetical protein